MNSFEKEHANALKKAAVKITELKNEVQRLKLINHHEALAVVGMNCLFPGGANNPEQFWQMLLDGADGICRTPHNRWEADFYVSKDTKQPGKINTKIGGFINIDVADFDAQFFGISPKEAVSMDPQQRLLLEVTWHALENAGINPQSLKESNSSVFIGSCLNDYQLVLHSDGDESEVDAYMATGNSSSVMAGRIAYTLGLQGPALSCDTACSSSLVVVHLACNALRNRETDLAIVGGVNLILSPNNSIIFSKANMLAEDGRCKAFDATANGYVRSEGCGVVILKRLEDAINSNDTILCVIKGTAINQDGRASGLTVPNASAQEQVINRALADASLSAADIDFIETHGTGTALGDPIELSAINKVFQGRTRELTLGSVKANIGHLEGAAGVAGLIKTILSLQHQKIPKQLHFTTLNPLISLDKIKGTIPIKTKKWLKNKNRIRRAGISSFGFSGTNAHIIVEEAPSIPVTKYAENTKQLFCFSAKTLDSLDLYLQKFADFLDDKIIGSVQSNEVSYTLNTGRAQFKHRKAFIASDLIELKKHITASKHLSLETIGSSLLVEQLAKEFLSGAWVDFSPLYPSPHHKVQLPGYVFHHQHYWIKSNMEKINSTQLDNIELFTRTWSATKSIKTTPLKDKAMLYLDSSLANLMDDGSIKDTSLIDIDGVLLCVDQNQINWQLFFSFIQHLINNKHELPLGFTIVTQKAISLPFRKQRYVASEQHAIATGLVKGLNLEAPQLHAQLVDVTTLKEQESLKIQLPQSESPLLAIHEGVYYQPEIKNLDSAVIKQTTPFCPEGTHWITGGTGSLGLSLAAELIKLGVTSLVLSSRTGESATIKSWLKKHRTKEVEIRIATIDMTHKESIARFITNENKRKKPLKGIYHLAGSNIQKPMKDLVWSQVEETIAAKMLGAKFLHELSKTLELNYFVFYSSIASVFGSNRQVPYVIANSYLDSLAAQRVEEGLPALVINWGPWSNSAMIYKKLDDTGLITQATGLNCFTQLIQSDLTQVSVMNPTFIPFMLAFYPEADAQWLGDLRSYKVNSLSTDRKMVDALMMLSVSERRVKLQALVSDAVQNALELADKPPINEGFFELGMDSLLAVEVVRTVQNNLGISLKPTTAFDYPNIEAVTNYLEELISNQLNPRTTNTIAPIAQEPIAIIGMSCQFPGEAYNLEKFWECLYQGTNCINEASSLRVDLDSHIKLQNKKSTKTISNKGGFIFGIDLFDAPFFNISPREAESLDPQQRLVLENTWTALEHANIPPETLKGKRVGIFVGISQSEYASFVLNKVHNKNVYHATGNALNAAAGRLAYTLGTQGPTMAIDTACSSSLVAVHEACNNLRLETCDLAIVAGVNAIIDPNIFITLANAEMLSPDGACKTFDAEANGYVRGEGCGVLILKRKKNLAKDERAFAFIRASDVNQDGASSGFTVPNGVAQQHLIKRVLQAAQLEPKDIDYLETHGSGTSLGDPIELSALSEVFAGKKEPLFIGTVKTNIGHLESASGIAGIIKAVLCVHNRWIPKHLNFNTLNPHIDLSIIPAVIPSEGMAFPLPSIKLLRAGVSSFGFSGTNAHLILEEAPQLRFVDQGLVQEHLFVLSGKTEWSLKELVQRYIKYLNTTKDSLADICHTAALGRSHFAFRLAIKVANINELSAKLLATQITHTTCTYESGIIQETHLDKLEKAYLAGERIDWPFYYQSLGVDFQKLVLPTYCFDKKPYWLEGDINDFESEEKIHPLLKNYTYSHHHNEYLFTSKLSLTFPSFVKDHTIFELPVIAGATYVSMLISYVLQIVEAQCGVISKLEFTQPLIVDSEKPRVLQLIVSDADKENSKFELVSYMGKTPNSFISHAQGFISNNSTWSPAPEPLSIPDLQNKLSKKYQGATHQLNVAKVGLHLGAHFHWIEEIYYNDHELLARMRMPNTVEKTEYDLYPGFIDASFQAMLAWVDVDLDHANLHIPISIDTISFIHPKNSPCYVHIARSNEMSATIRYLDEHGTEILCMEGFVAREVTKTTLLKILNIQYEQYAPIHYIDWQRAGINEFQVEAMGNNAAHIHLISTNTNSLAKLKKHLSPLQVTTSKKLVQNVLAEHVLFFYESTKLRGLEGFIVDKQGQFSCDSLYSLHKAVQALCDDPKIKSIGVIINDSLDSSLVVGYIKTLAQESLNKTVYLIKQDRAENALSLASIIKAQCMAITKERHITIRNGTCYVPRLLNQSAYETRNMVLPHSVGSKVLTCNNQLIDSIHWQDHPLPELGANQVRVEVAITSLNFRDVLKLMGTYPGKSEWHYFEHAGFVIEKGSAVEELQVGDKVLLLAENALCTVSQTDANKVYKIPEHIELTHACGIPAVFLTAYGCLYELAQIKQGDTVLIHAASGGVGLAAIQLAQLRGATIFVTTSDSKKEYLKARGIKHIYDSRKLGFAKQILKDTDNQGVDIVLNSLTSEGFIEESLRVVRQGGIFIEIGKINIFDRQTMSEYRPDIKYHIYALDERMALEQKKTAAQLNEIVKLHAEGLCQPLPNTVFDIRQAVDAFHYLKSGQHIGKVLIKHNRPFTYDASKTYLISGGLGGLGQMLVQHLMSKGVKHLTIIGQRDKTALPSWMTALTPNQITIRYYQCEVNDESKLSEIVQSINNSSQKLAGIFHLAGVLRDKPIVHLSQDDFAEVFKAKVLGSLALHKVSKHLDLDCFVLFSSITSLFGSPGQANYAAANAFMDELAIQRAAAGLAALSINWGPFAEVGMAKDHIKRYQSKGLNPLNKVTSFNAMDVLLERPYAKAIVADFDWNKASLFIHDAKILSLVHVNNKVRSISLETILQQTPQEQRALVLLTELKKMVASVMYIEDESEVDEHKGFFELGLDSLMSADLWAHLQSMLGQEVALSKTVLFEKNTVYKLSQYLQEEVYWSFFQAQKSEQELLVELEALLED